MTIFKTVLIGIIALLHIYFMILEMFLWTKPYGLKNFKNTKEVALSSAVLAANMGLYNGFLAAGLIASFFFRDINVQLAFRVFFLACIFIAGIYGGMTANKKIFFVQALPAVLALVLFLI